MAPSQNRENTSYQADNGIAYFVSPHGFGHAARSCAVMQEIYARRAHTRFEIFTTAPSWFFEISLQLPFSYHGLNTDIGLVQRTPLEEDLAATISRLEAFFPIDDLRIKPIADQLNRLNCSLVICDISPLGIAAAKWAGIPAILIENFTWDWIYEGFLDREPRFNRYIPEFTQLNEQVDAHIQTQPVCSFASNSSLLTNPVARRPRHKSIEIRSRLQIPEGARAVLISMGGFELKFDFLTQLSRCKDIYFIIPGGSDHEELRDNLALLPHRSDFFHPDLVHAANAIISKAGYSTISEAYFAGIPYGFVSRGQFRESPVLSRFILDQMTGIEINGSRFQDGDWVEEIHRLLQMPSINRSQINGAAQIADFLLKNFLQNSWKRSVEE